MRGKTTTDIGVSHRRLLVSKLHPFVFLGHRRVARQIHLAHGHRRALFPPLPHRLALLQSVSNQFEQVESSTRLEIVSPQTTDSAERRAGSGRGVRPDPSLLHFIEGELRVAREGLYPLHVLVDAADDHLSDSLSAIVLPTLVETIEGRRRVRENLSLPNVLPVETAFLLFGLALLAALGPRLRSSHEQMFEQRRSTVNRLELLFCL